MTEVRPDAFFAHLATLLRSRKDTVDDHKTLAFLVMDDGPYVVDTNGTDKMVWRGVKDDADATIICNSQTLSDILTGKFDATNPKPEHLFHWGGDPDALRSLGTLLAGREAARPD